MNGAAQREVARQQALLRALWRDDPADTLHDWLGEAQQGAKVRGLAAYRANAGAIAERALASAYPTVAALVGEESFAALARDFWQQHPPLRGDLGEWGADLPAFVGASTSLASEPYLADSAQLDWLVHRASRAADGPAHAPALDALGEHAPEALRLVLRPGSALLSSTWPVASLWQAHQKHGDGRFATAQAAFAAGIGEHALVHRDGLAVTVELLAADSAAFTAAILAGVSLSTALDVAGSHFAFDQWLLQALQQAWLVHVHPLPDP
ncbi:MAG: DNA-binding domain-containing protein [Pseudomonadota bacterium]